MVNRILVGAHYGLRDWIAQRATAVIMALYTVLFFITVAGVKPTTHDAWRALFSGVFMKFMTFLFFVSLFWHVWIGIRDIWMDYIKPTGLRLSLHVATIAVLVGYTGWAVKILWSL
jgi:succinate dehydrogenase / fumarate reductase membrane anchor subunit